MVLKLPSIEGLDNFLFSSHTYPRDKTALSTPRPTKTRLSQIIVAKDGSGHTDNINEALAMLPAEGGQIFVRQGTYDFSSISLNSDYDHVEIAGEGPASVINFLAATSSITLGAPSNETQRVLMLSNLTLDADIGNTNIINQTDTDSFLFMANLRVICSNGLSTKRIINSSAGSGFIVDCLFLDGDQRIVNNVDNYIIKGCIIEGDLSIGSDNSVHGCTISSTTDQSIAITGSNNSIYDNRLTNTGANGTGISSTITADTTYGYCTVNKTSWTAAHTAVTADNVQTSETFLFTGAYSVDVDEWHIYRSFVSFDLSGESGTLINAEIEMTTIATGNIANDIVAQEGEQSDPVVAADYDAFTGSEMGRTSGLIENTDVTLTLNSTGLSFVSGKLGSTAKFSLRDTNDFDDANTDEMDSTHWLTKIASPVPTTGGDEPQLILTYADGHGIVCEDGAVLNLMRGNHIDTVTGHGIKFEGNAGSSIIDHNIIDTATKAGVYLDDDNDKILIQGNIIKDCGVYGVNISAATCNHTLLMHNHLINNTGGAYNDAGTDTLEHYNRIT